MEIDKLAFQHHKFKIVILAVLRTVLPGYLGTHKAQTKHSPALLLLMSRKIYFFSFLAAS